MKKDVFAQAFLQIFQSFGFNGIEISEQPDEDMETDVISSIGVTGDLRGYFVIKSLQEHLRTFLHYVLESMELETELEDNFGKFSKSTFGEITNQIAGRAIMLLSEEGFDCLITPPTVIIGNKIHYTLLHSDINVHHRIQTSFGEFHLYSILQNK